MSVSRHGFVQPRWMPTNALSLSASFPTPTPSTVHHVKATQVALHDRGGHLHTEMIIVFVWIYIFD